MKTFKNIIVVFLLAFSFLACKNETAPEVVTVDNEVTEVSTDAVELDPNATYAKAEFTIEGMTCAMGCAKTIEKKMAKLDGVKSAKVDFSKRMAMVEYDEAKVTPENITATVTKAGEVYIVKNMKKVDAFSFEE